MTFLLDVLLAMVVPCFGGDVTIIKSMEPYPWDRFEDGVLAKEFNEYLSRSVYRWNWGPC